jgi:hypothetical protein
MWFDNRDPEFLDVASETFPIPELDVVSHRIYRHPSGMIYLIGEVKNRFECNLSVEVNAYLLEGGKVRGFGWASTLIPILIPGQKSPFRVIFNNVKDGFNHYSIKVKFGVTKQNPFREMKILEHYFNVNDSGYFIVYGRLKNVSQNKVDLVKVIGSFYGKDSAILALDIKPSKPESFEAYEEGEFRLTVPSRLLSTLVKSYSLDFWTPTGLNLFSIKW